MSLYKFCPGCDKKALAVWLLCLKGLRCPFCQCSESLNRHSILYGNDPDRSLGRRLRGQRVFCSNRGQRGGCGRSFPLFLADVLPRHTVTATLLWTLLCLLLTGLSLKAAFESFVSLFCLDTYYRLRRQLRGRLGVLRALLCRLKDPPVSSQSDPLLQTVEHFQTAFPDPDTPCPLGRFQLRLHQALMG